MDLLPQYPLSTSRILGLSITLYHRSFFNLLPFALAFGMVKLLPFVYRSGVDIVFVKDSHHALLNFWHSWQNPIAVGILSLFIMTFLFMASLARLHADAQNQQMGFAHACTIGLKFLPEVIMGSLFYMLLTLGGSTFCFIPGVYFSVAAAFFMMSIIDKHASGFKSILHSIKLCFGSFWRSAWILSIPVTLYILSVGIGILCLVGVMGNGILRAMMTAPLPTWPGSFLMYATFISIGLTCLFFPWCLATYYVVYHDLCVRQKTAAYHRSLMS